MPTAGDSKTWERAIFSPLDYISIKWTLAISKKEIFEEVSGGCICKGKEIGFEKKVPSTYNF